MGYFGDKIKGLFCASTDAGRGADEAENVWPTVPVPVKSSEPETPAPMEVPAAQTMSDTDNSSGEESSGSQHQDTAPSKTWGACFLWFLKELWILPWFVIPRIIGLTVILLVLVCYCGCCCGSKLAKKDESSADNGDEPDLENPAEPKAAESAWDLWTFVTALVDFAHFYRSRGNKTVPRRRPAEAGDNEGAPDLENPPAAETTRSLP